MSAAALSRDGGPCGPYGLRCFGGASYSANACGVSGRGRLRQFLEIGGALESHLYLYRSNCHFGADAATCGRGYKFGENSLFRFCALARRAVQSFRKSHRGKHHRRLWSDRGNRSGFWKPSRWCEKDRLYWHSLPLFRD